MENSVIKTNDQVIYRREIRGGTMTKIGSVVRLQPNGKNALVHFPTMNEKVVVPLSLLQKTAEVFNGMRVSPSPAQRTIRTYIP